MNCPLCHSTSEFWVEAHRREYYLCPACQLAFVPSRYYLPPEEEKARYLEHENSLENEGYVRMFQEKIDAIRRHCPHVTTALDYGCGYEPVLKTLLERAGFAADGYDLLFFPEIKEYSTYDLIISTETFEHLKQPGEEMARINGLLNPRGYLGVMTQFYPAPGGKPDAAAFGDWYYPRDPTHICFYGPQTFEWIAHHHNFDMIHNNGRDFVILQRNPLPNP